MKRYFFSAAAALLLTGYASLAQSDDSAQKQKAEADDRARSIQDQKQVIQNQAKILKEQAREYADDAKLGDYDEIIIKKKNPDANEKVTIEIKNDEVMVNGKPVEDFVNDAISVRVRSPKHFSWSGPSSPFRVQGNGWTTENDEGSDRAILGVETNPGSSTIMKVREGSAAEKAGLKENDVITRVGDKNVSNFKNLSEAVGLYKPGEKVTVTYKRNGKENKTTATLGKQVIKKRTMVINSGDGDDMMPEVPGAPLAPLPPLDFNFDDLNMNGVFGESGRPRMGIKAQDTEDGKGVKVLDVDGGSAAEKAGIKQEDVITSFDGKTVNTANELIEASRASRDKPSVKIEFMRNGKSQTTELKVPRKLRTANL